MLSKIKIHKVKMNSYNNISYASRKLPYKYINMDLKCHLNFQMKRVQKEHQLCY